MNINPIEDPIVERVVRLFENRSRIGILKYGVTMARKDLTPLQWLQHLQEELMDGILYLERLKDDMS